MMNVSVMKSYDQIWRKHVQATIDEEKRIANRSFQLCSVSKADQRELDQLPGTMSYPVTRSLGICAHILVIKVSAS
ncbi:hypothetical protein G7K_0445-t1 [Saitoella complicata NRRL Y-17804]|uniref:Uncharacterized protein n=1 Tax=Saitoella complicata (strain BCRC 22490 / CBS 7301 / JCM 7358 / NBRC 10748 / NRRL Y-17804) TaxID=698492 RepID=A0A0E9N9X7_SAICN|nr:hypothetical protein G7K_0445-t1 [Saitoella complicata NRRL Y-17804]